MPVQRITSQPEIDSLNAAYRPIVFGVRANGNIGTPPPVVFCDMYLNGVYYKTLTKTQYEETTANDALFLFDVADAVQEYLKFQLPVNGLSNVITASNVFATLYCKFRSSYNDANGYLIPEGTAPVQGTGSTAPVAGTGFQSNTLWAVNATLQHEENQSLETHLLEQKNNTMGSWATGVMPLTHRPKTYKICNGDSDYYPFIDKTERTYMCMKLFYKLKQALGFTEVQSCYCLPTGITPAVLPDGVIGVPYSATINLLGTGPFTLIQLDWPAWLTYNITGSVLTFGGTPDEVLDNTSISFDIRNCGGINSAHFEQVINKACNTSITGLSVVKSDEPPAQPFVIYTATWTNVNPGAISNWILEYSTDGGTTWQPVPSGAFTSNSSADYSLELTTDAAHILRVTPACLYSLTGTPATFNYTP